MRLKAIAAFVVMGSGCSGSAESLDDESIRQDTLKINLEVGSVDGEDGPAFGRITGVALGPDGSLFVADGQNHHIRVFSADGSALYEIGQEGSGPGALRSPCCINFDPDGNLWVRDQGNARYSAFRITDGDAALISTVRMTHGDPRREAPITFDEMLLADVGTATSDTGERYHVRHWLTRAGDVERADSFRIMRPEELGGALVVRNEGAVRFHLYPPYGPSDLLEFGPSGIHVEGVSSNYSLRVIGPTDTVAIERPTLPGPVLTGEERGVAEARLTQLATRIGGSQSDLPFGMPERKPPLHDAYFDRSGDLWVEKSEGLTSHRLADVWGVGEGRIVRRVAWPTDVSLSATSWIGAEWVVGVRRDELGVEYVVVMSKP